MRRNYTELPGSSNTVQANWVDNGVDPTEDMPLLRGQQAPTEVANDEDISCYQRYCPGKIQSNMTMDTALSAVKYTVFILIDAHAWIDTLALSSSISWHTKIGDFIKNAWIWGQILSPLLCIKLMSFSRSVCYVLLKWIQ